MPISFSFEDFKKLTASHSIIALETTINFDHETSITLADRFHDRTNFFLLESAASGGGGTVARYSYIGFDPIWEWESEGKSATLKRGKENQEIDLKNTDTITQMALEFERLNLGCLTQCKESVAPIGGAIGYFGYDVSSQVEPSIGTTPPKKLGLPDCHFFIPANLFVVDQLTKNLHIIRYVDIEKSHDLKLTFENELKKMEGLIRELEHAHHLSVLKTKDGAINLDAMTTTLEHKDFLRSVKELKEEINAGEIYQIQIGRRLSQKTHARPFDVFRHLRMLNPSPYMFYYNFSGHQILGASPEMMVNVQDGVMTHRPIAGTRRRYWNEAKDNKMKHELVNSEKERAEHVMLVDLSRNDIGRVSQAGSVEVEELMVVEQYSHVFHMVSHITGTLKAEFDRKEALKYSFPNGTVSGAPKIRAMELINQHEHVSREFYAGTLGVFEFSGNLKSTLLIRTIHIKDQMASTHASAGIVYDSIPEEEWLETKNKMMACATAIQNTL